MKRRQRYQTSGRSVIALVVVFLASSYALYTWCYLPYRCNVFKRAAESSMMAIQNIDGSMRRAMIARQNLTLALGWIHRCPTDVDLYMIAGGSFRQRRPEIYLNLGQSQVEAG